MKRIFMFMSIIASIMFVISCASSDTTGTGSAVQNELAGAPDWVLGNSNGDGKICGTGSAAGTRNPSLARTAAMGRGRTEIARTLSVKVKSMLKDYQATTTGGKDFGKAANDEQHIEDVSKQITNNSISGSELEKTWISKTGTLYVLMCVDLNKFKDLVNQMQQLDEKTRQAIVERADKAFNELDKETSK